MPFYLLLIFKALLYGVGMGLSYLSHFWFDKDTAGIPTWYFWLAVILWPLFFVGYAFGLIGMGIYLIYTS
jgi:uncharacterized protein involved in cysteine biosynthesis